MRSIAPLLVALGGLVVVFASANDFTHNWLHTRYDTKTASGGGRTNLALQDWDTFRAHPLWGVGSGRSPEFHFGGNLTGEAAHTEYTRLMAEKGVFGIF